MNRIKEIFLLLIVIILIGGCGATLHNMRKRSLTEGKEKTFSATIDDTLFAIKLACGQLYFNDIDSEEKISEDTWMIIAKKSKNLLTSGSYIRILATIKAENETSVRIVTKRIDPLDIMAKDDYSDYIFEKIEYLLLINETTKENDKDSIALDSKSFQRGAYNG